jgi:hypothetical protein
MPNSESIDDISPSQVTNQSGVEQGVGSGVVHDSPMQTTTVHAEASYGGKQAMLLPDERRRRKVVSNEVFQSMENISRAPLMLRGTGVFSADIS